MYQGADAWHTPQGEFVQWGGFSVSANSLDVEDDDYYLVANVPNVSDSPENEANARLIHDGNYMGRKNIISCSNCSHEWRGRITSEELQ